MRGIRGTVYTAGTRTMVAYNSTGRVEWRYRKSDGALALAERGDGTILIAGSRRLDALSPAGRRLWRASIGRSSAWPPAIAIDVTGRAYVATDDGELRILSRTGRLLHTVPIGGRVSSPSPPAVLIGQERLIVTGTDGKLRIYGP